MDRKRGMILGVLLGDALGAPLEFNRKQEYSGKLEYETRINTRFQGTKILPVGSITDDSNMTLCLLKSINRNDGKYDREDVIMSYMKWANSTWIMGRNTRSILKGIKTIRGYENRIVKLKPTSQSNGSLMRCSPLALLKRDKYVIIDCDITNPNDINREVNLIFVSALRMCLKGERDKDKIIRKVKRLATFDEIKIIFKQDERDIITNKGWCVHGLWCAIYCLKNFDNFEKAMKWVITSQRGSDTDTNASIAGALLGAYLGFDEILSHSKSKYNYELICKVNDLDVLELIQ